MIRFSMLVPCVWLRLIALCKMQLGATWLGETCSTHINLSGTATVLPQPYACRFSGLNSISIKLQHAGKDGSLDPVLALLHLHATALRCLSLQFSSSSVEHHMTWGSLGKMVNLTKLQLSFGPKVCRSMVRTV